MGTTKIIEVTKEITKLKRENESRKTAISMLWDKVIFLEKKIKNLTK